MSREDLNKRVSEMIGQRQEQEAQWRRAAPPNASILRFQQVREEPMSREDLNKSEEELFYIAHPELRQYRK